MAPAKIDVILAEVSGVRSLASRLVMGSARTHGASAAGAQRWAEAAEELVMSYPERTRPQSIMLLEDVADRAECILTLSEARRTGMTALALTFGRVGRRIPPSVRRKLQDLTDCSN